MTAAAALALALAAAPGAPLAPLAPGTARWRFELSGEHVGFAELAVSCAGARCAIAWRSEQRAPADAGGRSSSRRVDVEVDREGRWRGGPVRVAGDGGATGGTGVPGAVPASIVEVVLARGLPPGPGSGLCVDAFEEATGRRGRACARREGAALAVDVLGVAEAVVAGADGLPASLEIPRQGARFVRDDGARLPREAPRLHGSRVPGPRDPAAARSFCGIPRDPEAAEPAPGAVPAPEAEGASCLERTATWLARAANAGLRGRTAVGVAWDGTRFVWHAWAEVRLAPGWIPIDPSFGELPARGPRFTLATYGPGDEAARLAAGERILACWGRATVRPP